MIVGGFFHRPGQRSRRYINRTTLHGPAMAGVHGYDEGFTILENGMELQDFLFGRAEYMLYLREQGLTLREISIRLGVKSHQLVHQTLVTHEKRKRNLASRVAGLLDHLV